MTFRVEIKQLRKKISFRKINIVWKTLSYLAILHLMGGYGFYLLLTLKIKCLTILFGTLVGVIGSLGVTAGAHRLWSHRSYKAKWPVRLFLMLLDCTTSQSDVITWARDHRTHHKFCDTDADPYNAKRGFFFSHMGWLMCRKHPDVISKGKTIDYSDLYADPFLRFQRKYYILLYVVIGWIIMILIPIYLWDESFENILFGNALRICLGLHGTFLVNSAAHYYGSRPYTKDITPGDSKFLAIFTLGESWHNYHHTFPWDYKTAELGNYDANLTCAFIDFMAKIGLAFDLKTVSKDMIKKRVARTGDGTHQMY